MLRQNLLRHRYSLLVSSPHNFSHSNGISVLLDAAQQLRAQGVNVCIVPAESNQPRYTHLPYPYDDLPVSHEVIPGSYVLITDTISPERLEEARIRASRICHYTLAPSGLFSAPFSNRVHIQQGERQAVYSALVSTRLPYFYFQSRFPELEPWIAHSCSSPRRSDPRGRPGGLRASIYAGKGYLRPLARPLRKLINRGDSRLITRHEPSTKKELYRLLSETDLLVCFDPITSLAHEAILMGIPVYIPLSWDEPSYAEGYPVRLDGIEYNDVGRFLDILDQGFDHQAVVDSYLSAIQANGQSMADLLSFAFDDSSPAPSAAELNAYWDSRQRFFASLKLPSPPSAWSPIERALLAYTPAERVKALIDVICIRIAGMGERLFSTLRRIKRVFRRC